jgi:hypothetical protein
MGGFQADLKQLKAETVAVQQRLCTEVKQELFVPHDQQRWQSLGNWRRLLLIGDVSMCRSIQLLVIEKLTA